MAWFLPGLQRLGRSLMLPIAVLPIAALLLRLGQPDLLNFAFIAAAGDAIFSNLGLLFAIGVAVGLARDNHGAAGLAAVVGYLVAAQGAEVLLPGPAEAVAGLAGAAHGLTAAAFKAQQLAKLSVPLGILSGICAGFAYNRYSDTRLPSYLAFFGGRRFVPILTGCAGLALAGAFALGWPYLERGIGASSHVILGSGTLAPFIYGVLNRLLLITGLHHILNNIAWFLIGDFHGVTGDLKRFFAGDPTAGVFMSGFFPVMMFGLPAACLAMYRTAAPERRAEVAGILLSMALTSFLTGVTEPIEFTFIFLAPALYVIHAVLTGVAMALMQMFGIHLGFSFSAGLFDYVLNFGRATRPLLFLPMGVAYFVIYYALFRYFIVRFDLKTPGRDNGPAVLGRIVAEDRDQARAFIAALGGEGNLRSVDACTTRLRIPVVNASRVDREALRRLGVRGVVQVADEIQVVVGPVADQLATHIRASLRGSASVTETRVPPATPASAGADAFLAAMGGAENVIALESCADRVLVSVRDNTLLDESALSRLGVRGIARPVNAPLQLLSGNAEWVTALRGRC